MHRKMIQHLILSLDSRKSYKGEGPASIEKIEKLENQIGVKRQDSFMSLFKIMTFLAFFHLIFNANFKLYGPSP